MGDVLQALQELSPYLFFTIAILFGAVREWWVWGHVYRRERAEKEYWREKALAHLGLAESTIELAATEMVEP